jgi:Tol biopolymer transport system component
MRRSLLALVLVVAAAQAGGCDRDVDNGNNNNDDQGVPTPGDGSMAACIPDLTDITLAPADSTQTIDGNTAAPIGFTVTGNYADGHMAAIDPASLDWSVSRADDTPPGTISGGTLTPNPAAGGTLTVTAADGCGHTGSTTITLKLDATLGTPSDPTAWSATPSGAGSLPLVVYPSDQTRFPRNIFRTLFHWRTQGYTQFRLTFDGPGSKVTVYTDGTHMLCAGKTPAAGCWEADETAWSFIAGSNAGGTVSWTLDALDTSTVPATIRRAAPITIGFSKRDVTGAIFYWSTTSAGVRRANVHDAYPEDYITGKPGTTYSAPTNQVKCVACHVVSRDGKYLAAPVQASTGSGLWVAQVTTTAPPTPLLTPVANTMGNGFATFSPDDAQVVAAWGGKMWSVDRATGNKIADLPLGTIKATHPDWSPDNTQLVFATAAGDAPSGASLAVIPYNAGTWGSPTTIVPAGTLSNLFPQFSPDGKWIAYTRGKGGHGDVTMQLNVVASTGGTPTELINANRVISNKTTTGQFENAQPTWAPPGDFHWVAFNSQREYGVVQTAGTQQIWVAAIDPSKLGSGQDPSFPAFRLQFQGLTENNHRAYWTLDVRDPVDGGAPPADLMPPGDAMCIQSNKTCDPVADSCCSTNDTCDTNDNGATYTCMQKIL